MSKKIKQKEQLTPAEYASIKKVRVQGVTRKIREGLPLEGISEVREFGRFYILKVGNWADVIKPRPKSKAKNKLSN